MLSFSVRDWFGLDALSGSPGGVGRSFIFLTRLASAGGLLLRECWRLSELRIGLGSGCGLSSPSPLRRSQLPNGFYLDDLTRSHLLPAGAVARPVWMLLLGSLILLVSGFHPEDDVDDVGVTHTFRSQLKDEPCTFAHCHCFRLLSIVLSFGLPLLTLVLYHG